MLVREITNFFAITELRSATVADILSQQYDCVILWETAPEFSDQHLAAVSSMEIKTLLVLIRKELGGSSHGFPVQ